MLLGGLSQVHLASASTQALRGICEECVQDLGPGSLMEILTHCQVISCFVAMLRESHFCDPQILIFLAVFNLNISVT